MSVYVAAGTLPVNEQEMNVVQVLDGIASGDRYLNMSCCDKVARWAVLGFQGRRDFQLSFQYLIYFTLKLICIL